ncbi:4-hydroxy-3-methylbut-2-enyl diphosphate reductase [Thermoproteota archaeon]
MKIKVAKSAGFCFGVKRALEITFGAAKTKNQVYMLGDIVHNEQVVEQIKNAGVKKIKHLAQGKNKTLLIRAHGASKHTLKRAMSLRYNIVDATCPMVKEIHRIAVQSEKKGYKIIIIGDNKHDEVRGIIGQLKRKSLVIDNKKNIDLKSLKRINRAAVVVQSTQNLESVLNIVEILKQNIPILKFFNTICKPTRIKQDEIRRLPLKTDIMIIIGSKGSANTKRLYEISKTYNRRTYWIQSKNQLKKIWFKDAKSVGITAGASTPDETTRDVIAFIKERYR